MTDDIGGSVHNVKQANYPIQQPLTHLLQAVILDKAQSIAADTESCEHALAQIVGNSFEAMDTMYFATPANRRKHTAFGHRLCVRVATDRSKKTLSITDLGAGMTRSDLINALGVGRLSRRAHAASNWLASKENRDEGEDDLNPPKSSDADENIATGASRQTSDHDLLGATGGVAKDEADANDDQGSNGGDTVVTEEAYDEDDEDDEDDDEEEEEDIGLLDEEDYEVDEDEYEEEGGGETKQETDTVPSALPCRTSDLGGFYAALCALGVGINVGTKSKFDDYYEFEVGVGLSFKQSDFTSFSISRPMDEGVKPTAKNGYGRFEDVRGESGTRVTVVLKDELIEKGFLEEETLRPIFTHIFETSQHTVAFSSDEDCMEIIEASQKEEEAWEELDRNISSACDEAFPEEFATNGGEHDNENGYTRVGSHNTVLERAKYIPLRLSLEARKMLRLVEASMACCDYTTEVDKPFKSAARRTHAQLKGVTAILRGLVTACDYTAGQRLLEDDNYSDYEKFFCQMFEIARRHKIMNPEKMRTEYGKLTYLLQDAVSPTVQPHLSFSCKGPIETVHKFLQERNGLALLEDKLIETATEEILAGKKSRATISAEIQRKERAVAALKKKYRSARLSSEDIHLCLYSICDNNSFLNSNRVPIDKIIRFLKKYFAPEQIQAGYSLSIISGTDGARLSHSHERQYYFALQSLTLWRDIIDDMFRLWHMAEEDLLSETVTYALQDTGQGMQRVQQCPRTYRAMQQILARVQGKVNQWVGSSVIHMGDHNVPNALSFIDKYTQVPRFLGPIVICLENLERLCEDNKGIKDMVMTGYGGIEKLRKDILHDFFRSAFDGSGADNFYDAGSCIDGRLTSAWNWCSQLSSKPYYPIFKLTGFIGFDGEWKN